MSKYYDYFSVSRIGSSASGKTDIYSVVSHRNDLLGTIKWYGPWRGYAFFVDSQTILSPGCLDDIKDAILVVTKMKDDPTLAWDD